MWGGGWGEGRDSLLRFWNSMLRKETDFKMMKRLRKESFFHVAPRPFEGQRPEYQWISRAIEIATGENWSITGTQNFELQRSMTAPHRSG